jgi:hypothetical protein
MEPLRKTHWSPARHTRSAGSSLVSSGKPARTCWCMAVIRREVLAPSATPRPAVVRRISLRSTARRLAEVRRFLLEKMHDGYRRRSLGAARWWRADCPGIAVPSTSVISWGTESLLTLC